MYLDTNEVISEIKNILLLSFSRMKNVIIKPVYAVGMSHYGPKELRVGGIFQAKREINNTHDVNAVALYDGPRKVAYLKRHSALLIAKLMDQNVNRSAFFFKASVPAEFINRRLGYTQRCSIGFKCPDSNVEKVETIFNTSSVDQSLTIRHGM